MQNNTAEERTCKGSNGNKIKEKISYLPKEIFKGGEQAEYEVTPLNEAGSNPMDASEKFIFQHPLREKIPCGLTTFDLNAIVEEIGGKPKILSSNFVGGKPIEQSKKLAETKKLLDNVKEKVAAYPQYLTYEGSVVLCVLLSVNEGKSISLGGLPSVDRDMILDKLPTNASLSLLSATANLEVSFDETQDFILTYQCDTPETPPTIIRFFNTVIHPHHTQDKAVPIKRDGEKISLGGKFMFDKKDIRRRMGLTSNHEKEEEEEYVSRRQPVSGRNAFELRTDLIQFSVDLLFHNNKNHISPEEVVAVAKVLYTFVENKYR